eukprot:1297042-Pleurochrysis_carterae.AAC.2
MRTECCRLCKSTRGHWSLKARIQHELDEEYHRAKEEHTSLLRLYNNACWYNFEIACITWKHPWHTTDPDSFLQLQTKHSVWFAGTVSCAPKLPMLILQREVELAHAYMRYCEQGINAAFDWAPGGVEYRQHLKSSEIAKICMVHRT